MKGHTGFLKKASLLLLVLGVVGTIGVYFRGPGDAANAALNYQDPVTLRFTLNSTLSLALDSNAYTIGALTPGNSANSNVVKATVTTNSGTGYTLRATVGSASNASTQLRLNGTDTSNYFACASSLAADKWVFSTSTNNSTWTNRDCLPVYTSTGASILSSSSYAATGEVYTRISAQASAAKTRGSYSNVINFAVVAN